MCIRSSELILLIPGSLYSLPPFPLLPVPGNQHSVLCLYEIGFFFLKKKKRALTGCNGTEHLPASPPWGGAQLFPGLSDVWYHHHARASVPRASPYQPSCGRPPWREAPSPRLPWLHPARPRSAPVPRLFPLAGACLLSLSTPALPFEIVPICSSPRSSEGSQSYSCCLKQTGILVLSVRHWQNHGDAWSWGL